LRTHSLTVLTSELQIAYEQTGPDRGEPIVLLHGFPYDVREYDPVRDRLAVFGHRILVPYLRGFGPTRYRSPDTFRSGQQAAIGKDVIDFLDALKIERATLVGFDWGARAACVAAALWPERVRALVSVGGYTIQEIAKASVTPQSAEQEHQYWYQWYFQTERGRAGLAQHRKELCKLLWKLWSPNWSFGEGLFAITAKSFYNPDFVSTVIQSYRHRYSNAAGDPSLDRLESRLAGRPKIYAPAIILEGAEDQVDPPLDFEGQKSQFKGYCEYRLLPGVGHCAPAEAPAAVAQAIDDILRVSQVPAQ
jgi:pimeloyl-ACP methyl ester carboxylesterase